MRLDSSNASCENGDQAMSVDRNKLDRCAREGCRCSIKGGAFCGPYCEQAAGALESAGASCECSHPECDESIELVGGPASGRI